MNRFDSLSERAQRLAGIMGENVRHAMPRAGQLFGTGGKLVALKTGTRNAGTFVRRHPVMLAATVAGAGVLWYVLRQRAGRVQRGEEREAIEGTAQRVDARRAARRAARASRLHRSREERPTA